MARHKTILYLDTSDIARAALDAFGGRDVQSGSDQEAEEFISRLMKDRWKWTEESREDYVARMSKLIDDACGEKERLIRGYGGNCSYNFQKLYGPGEGDR